MDTLIIETKKLSTTIYKLETEMNNVQQLSTTQNLEIKSVPEKENENLIVIKRYDNLSIIKLDIIQNILEVRVVAKTKNYKYLWITKLIYFTRKDRVLY